MTYIYQTPYYNPYHAVYYRQNKKIKTDIVKNEDDIFTQLKLTIKKIFCMHEN